MTETAPRPIKIKKTGIKIQNSHFFFRGGFGEFSVGLVIFGGGGGGGGGGGAAAEDDWSLKILSTRSPIMNR
jgi:hypothetical protein